MACVNAMPSDGLASVTLAPGITAPVESVTTPVTDELSWAGIAIGSMPTASRHARGSWGSRIGFEVSSFCWLFPRIGKFGYCVASQKPRSAGFLRYVTSCSIA